MRAGSQVDRPPIVLIFVSLCERFATVIAEEPIQQQLTSGAVGAIRAVILDELAKRRLGDALCQAVSLTADLVSHPCPPAPNGAAADESRAVLRVIG